jgi:hypothetical protein
MTVQQQWEWLQPHATKVLEYRPPPLDLPTLIFIAIAISAVAYFLGTRTKAAARERKMRAEREKHVKMRIGDAIVEAVEDLINKSELSRSEAGFWYKRIGHVLTLPDVLPKEMKALKERLKEKHKGKTKSNVTAFKPVRRKAM